MGDGGRIDQRVHRPSVHRFLLFLCSNRRLHGHEPLPQRQLRRQSSQGSSSKSGHRVRASRGAPSAEARRGHTRSVFSRTSNGSNKNSEYSAIKSSKKEGCPEATAKTERCSYVSVSATSFVPDSLLKIRQLRTRWLSTHFMNIMKVIYMNCFKMKSL